MSVEERVQSAMEEVQDRLKKLEDTTREQVHHHHIHSLCLSLPLLSSSVFDINSLPKRIQSAMEPSQNTLKPPIVMSRQVSFYNLLILICV